MKHVIEFDEKCKSCDGTGLYVGIGERDGAAVVCAICKGTGCKHTVVTYEDFEKRKIREEAVHIYEVNPGITIGSNKECHFTDFGGMPYKDWLDGKPFEVGMENRNYTCPCWWYQLADYEKKPNWDECSRNIGRSFSACKHFKDKAKCWERFDRKET